MSQLNKQWQLVFFAKKRISKQKKEKNGNCLQNYVQDIGTIRRSDWSFRLTGVASLNTLVGHLLGVVSEEAPRKDGQVDRVVGTVVLAESQVEEVPQRVDGGEEQVCQHQTAAHRAHVFGELEGVIPPRQGIQLLGEMLHVEIS